MSSNANNSKSSQVRALLATGMSVAEIAKKVGCTPNLVYVVKAKAKAGGGGKKRGPGRPRKTLSAAAGLASLDGILDVVKNSERERTQLRMALERIQAVIDSALTPS